MTCPDEFGADGKSMKTDASINTAGFSTGIGKSEERRIPQPAITAKRGKAKVRKEVNSFFVEVEISIFLLRTVF